MSECKALQVKHFLNRLRKWMKRSNSSMADLAFCTGIAKVTIYSWFNGARTPGKKSMEHVIKSIYPDKKLSEFQTSLVLEDLESDKMKDPAVPMLRLFRLLSKAVPTCDVAFTLTDSRSEISVRCPFKLEFFRILIENGQSTFVKETGYSGFETLLSGDFTSHFMYTVLDIVGDYAKKVSRKPVMHNYYAAIQGMVDDATQNI